MSAVTLLYEPLDPDGVVSVPRLRLFPTPERTTPTVDAGPLVAAGDGTWSITVDIPDGTYWRSVTVVYLDGTTSDDTTGEALRFPVPEVRDETEPLEPWCRPADLPAGTDPVFADLACQVATDVLWALSGRKYPGLRRTTVLAPVLPGHDCDPLPGYTPHRSLHGRHGTGSRLADPGVRPLVQVLAVTVNGVEVTATLREDRILLPAADTLGPLSVNADPETGARLGPWCGCCGGPGQVQATVVYGALPPAAGRASAVALASELVKALKGEKCLLPGNTTSVSRQGVTVLLDPTSFLDGGRTGVPLADLWLSSVNPHRLLQPATVWSPDTPLPVRL